MLIIAARTRTPWRIVASAAVALIATTGLATAASAAPGPNAAFTWTGVSLTTDFNANGIPDVGDVVTYSYRVAVNADAPSPLASFTITGINYSASQTGLAIAPGATQDFTMGLPVTTLMLDQLGGGPHLLGAMVTHKVSSQVLPRMATMAAPPVLYTAPAPLSVSSSFDMTEVYGSVPGELVEGDQVSYVTRVTNTSSVAVTLNATGYDSPAGPQVVAAGAYVDFASAPVVVTYADMEAGGVSFADASIDWRITIGLISGTVAAPIGTAPTESISPAASTFAKFTVHHAADGSKAAMGTAIAGDMIDVKLDVTNDGNVTLNYIAYVLDPWAAVYSNSNNASGLTPGASLPNGIWKPKDLRSANGFIPAYVLTDADIARGYVDVGASISAAPSLAAFGVDPGWYTTSFAERVFLKDFNTRANLKFTDATLNDTNGDGIGQSGETVDYRVRFLNNADQSLTLDATSDAAGSDVAVPVAAKFIGASVAPDRVIAKRWTYVITPADEARGSIDAGVVVDYTGDVDGGTNSREAWADTVLTGAYVAPSTTLDTTATYVDTNTDGFPSIGETVHVTVTVTNTGAYALTGLAVTDAPGSDVAGLLPAFTSALAAGATASASFDYVLTAGDFARGSLSYSTEMTADGLATTPSATSVNLTPVTFQSYSTDLDGVLAGGISVCQADGTPTDTVTILTNIIVVPGNSCSYAGLAFGYRVVGYSTPLVLGTSTFSVTVPIAIHVGAHRIALYAPNGTLVGYRDVTVKDPIAFAGDEDGALAFTGADGDGLVGIGGGAAVLMLLGTAFVVADSRRRRHAAH